MPTISQCPVVVSFPGDAKAHRPYAPVGALTGSSPVRGFMLARPSAHRFGRREQPLARDVAECVAACVAVIGGIRHFTDTHRIENNPDDSAENRHCSRPR